MLIKGSRINAKTVGDSNNFTIKLGNHVIEKTESYKYLGIIFDNKLSWKPHIDNLTKKLQSACG